MAGFGQYLKETQGELRHVAWPTQLQTIVYTILVAAISVGIALYLGVFDYLFTSGIKQVIDRTPTPTTATTSPIQVTQVNTTPVNTNPLAPTTNQ
ncbi:MAG: Protein translocase complex, SecE/Sec61-gamma subunit [Candidatus Kaiserbacteria bacterium]|nr:Protein translocase complex, SecE/Sec61-gamma subunit [Candidatus Kaiserbacteria bacterium]